MESEKAIENRQFNRLFSLTLYKNKKISLGEMSFYKDFIHDSRGDLYPVLERNGGFHESITDGSYRFDGGQDAFCTRLIGAFFPYATYEISLAALEGEAGFCFCKSDGQAASVIFRKEKDSDTIRVKNTDSGIPFAADMRFIVSCHGRHMDVYYQSPNGIPHFWQTVTANGFDDICHESVFRRAKAALYVSGKAVVGKVEAYMDCGVSQADMRPIRYENGEILTENGKIFLSMTIRMQEECYQGIFSWIPGTSEFELCGTLFYDAGDGIFANDVAVSLLYHRSEKKWLYWVCSFYHGHRLAYGSCSGEVRYGVNVLHTKLMPFMPENAPDTAFLAKEGDEDPDFIYDEAAKMWYMTVCRPVKEQDGVSRYRYFLFRSHDPFEGYEPVSHALSGEETGGSFVRDGKGLAFVCGNGFAKRAEYRVYRVPELSEFSLLKHDYDDGGFRGWGTVIPVLHGSRKSYYHLTFDRHNASDYTWSYGNLYCFKAEE